MPIDPSSVQAIFLAAVQQTAESRASLLDRECNGDPELRRRVETLLEAHDEPGSFPYSRPAAFAGTIDMPGEPSIGAQPGTQIGPYKLLQQIGAGGMGVVYMAEQAAPVRRKVALKIIKPGMDSHEVLARFEAERQALALMDHPNIAHVFDGGATEAGRPYFVMELVRGVPVTDYCDQNDLPVHERLELFVTVCHAVQHAHQKGIIHRDIKPSNVLVTLHDGRPVPKVIDFGVAKAIGQQLTDKTLFTQFAQMVGTPLYMSPEQAQLTGLDVDTRGDIYSLGVMLYELLTGTTPFERGRVKQAAIEEIRRMIREEEPPSPSTRLSSTAGAAQSAVAAHRRVDPRGLSRLVRGDLDWIVMKALEKDRTRRYETANGFARDVERYLADEPVQACPPSSAYRFRKFARRNRAALAVGTIVVTALLIAVSTLAVSYAMVRQQSDAKELALQEKSKALGDKVTALGEKDKALETARFQEDLATKRLFRSLVAQAKANRLSRRVGQRFESLEVLREASRMALTMALPDVDFLELRHEAIACLTISDVQIASEWTGWPAGSVQVGFDGALEHYARVDREGNISVYRTSDNVKLWILLGLGPSEAWPIFSPNGQFLVVWNGAFKLWNMGGQEPILIGEGQGQSAAFSRDSQQVALLWPEGLVRVFDLPSGNQLKEFRVGPLSSSLAYHPHLRQLAVSTKAGVRVIDIETGNELAFLPQGNASNLDWHPDGKTLAISGIVPGESNIFCWDVASRKLIAELKGHADAGTCFAFNNTGDVLASSGWYQPLRLWNPQSGELLFQTSMHMEPSLRFSPDGRRLSAVTPGQGRLRILEIADVESCYRTLVRDPILGRGFCDQLAISPNGRILAAAMPDGAALWDAHNGKPLTFLPAGHLKSVRFEPSGALVSSGHAGLMRWAIEVDASAPSKVCIGSQEKLAFGESSEEMGISRDGRIVAQARSWGGIVWDRKKLNPPFSLPHEDTRYIDVSPDGHWVATGSHSGTNVKIWDASTGKLAHELPTEGPAYVVFSADGRWLVTGADGNRLWSVDTWQQARYLGGRGGVDFSSDGKLLAVETGSGIIRLINPDTGLDYARLEDPHQDRANNIRFSPDGTQLAFTTQEGTAIHLWNLRSIRERLSVMGLDWDLPPYPPADVTEAIPLDSTCRVMDGV